MTQRTDRIAKVLRTASDAIEVERKAYEAGAMSPMLDADMAEAMAVGIFLGVVSSNFETWDAARKKVF